MHLHYEVDGWLGDDLLQSFPCFIVTDRLAHALRRSDLTGCSLAAVEVTKSSKFNDWNPGKELPGFFWLRITGRAGVDDFGISEDRRLVASTRAMDVLRPFNLDHAERAIYAPRKRD